MCGHRRRDFVGTTASPVTEPLLRAMAGRIAHRGPDGEGVVLRHDGGVAVGLAFRRLAVLDRDERAMQPMRSPDGRFTLVFNGEVYNFHDIKRQLPPRDWRTTGDTEVLLAALAEWGVAAALPRLDGMFAFALWDARERTLTLARDRVGQKPLYFTEAQGSLAFASELAALGPWPQWSRDVAEWPLAPLFAVRIPAAGRDDLPRRPPSAAGGVRHARRRPAATGAAALLVHAAAAVDAENGADAAADTRRRRVRRRAAARQRRAAGRVSVRRDRQRRDRVVRETGRAGADVFDRLPTTRGTTRRRTPKPSPGTWAPSTARSA